MEFTYPRSGNWKNKSCTRKCRCRLSRCNTADALNCQHLLKLMTNEGYYPNQSPTDRMTLWHAFAIEEMGNMINALYPILAGLSGRH
jgi:hypothetical protein